MRERGYASWERAQRHMRRSGMCLGTVQMRCRCTGGSMGEGVILAGKLVEWYCVGSYSLGLWHFWSLGFIKVCTQAADSIGCSILNNQFRYLGVMVRDNMSRLKAWDDIILKIKSRLSKWKVKTLSIGGRLTLLKSVLGASPIYVMSIFTVPRGVLKTLESIRNRFFNGADQSNHKITWVAWNKVLASRKKEA
nr:RNA-directed DNA polymerase, eukaryota [Tanacetum cinerariifolium]